jgi:hypothetical protein
MAVDLSCRPAMIVVPRDAIRNPIVVLPQALWELVE